VIDIEFLKTALQVVEGSPLLQGTLAAFCTFILEDPTVVTCGLLVAEEHMGFWTAIIGLSLGITIGDMGLYVIGRFFGPWVRARKWVKEERYERAKELLDQNLVTAIIAARFLPGTRIPVFVGSGLFGASPWKFLVVAQIASLLWTMFLLTITVHLGRMVLPFLGEMKWPMMISAATIIVMLTWLRKRRNQRREEAAARAAAETEATPEA